MKISKSTKRPETGKKPAASSPKTLNQRLAAGERAELKKLEQRLPTALN